MLPAASASGEEMIANAHDDDMVHFETTTTSTKISGSGMSESETATTTSGYYDGKMFTSHKDNDVDQKLWSEITLDGYKSYLESKTSDTDFKVEYFNNVEVDRDDDGSWEMSLSGINSEGLKEMLNMLNGLDQLFASVFTVKDIEVTMELDKKYIPQSLEFVVVFEKTGTDSSAKMPAITVEAEYKDFNDTEIDEPDLDGYTKTGDLSAVQKVLNSIEKMEKYDETLNFTANLLVRVSDATNGTSYARNSYKYTGTAYYEAENKFKYVIKEHDGDISNPSSSQITVYNYSNGRASVGRASSTNGTSTECTDFEAKEFVSSLVHSHNLAMYYVESVSVKNDNSYEFVLSPASADELKEGLEEEGAKVTSVTATLTVTMNGDKISDYVYTATVYYTSVGVKCKLIQTMSVTFN